MQLALLGVGQAGGKIVDEFLRYDERTEGTIIQSASVVNTARVDLQGLEYVPPDNRVLIGQSRVSGHGVGADNELASTIFAENLDELGETLDEIPVHQVDAFVVVAALGGGTGSGGGPVIIRHLQRLSTEPVYGLGVLPAGDEGGLYTLNAARSLRTFVREADNLLVFDNAAWRDPGESAGDAYATMNEALVRRLGVLFSAGDHSSGDVGARVVDSSEIINTLASGGVSTIGYATASLGDGASGGLLSRFEVDDGPIEDSATATSRITGLVRKATLGRLTLPCDVSGVERALLVVAGPPEFLNRKGIERAQNWLGDETGSLEIRGGDAPIPGEDKAAGVVLLSGLTNVPRIDRLQRSAVESRDTAERIASEHDTNIDGLMDDELDPLF